jgi:hypothetical protein
LEVNLLEKNVDILGEEAEQLVVDKIVWDWYLETAEKLEVKIGNNVDYYEYNMNVLQLEFVLELFANYIDWE